MSRCVLAVVVVLCEFEVDVVFGLEPCSSMAETAPLEHVGHTPYNVYVSTRLQIPSSPCSYLSAIFRTMARGMLDFAVWAMGMRAGESTASLFCFLLAGAGDDCADGHRNAGGAGLPSATEADTTRESSDKRVDDGAREGDVAGASFRRRRRGLQDGS